MRLSNRTWLLNLAASYCLLNDPTVSAGVVITFDNLSAMPSVNNFTGLATANGNSLTISGVTFGPGFNVVGDQYVELFQNTGGSHPFAQPHSGHYGIFNGSGANALTLTTSETLTGVWFGNPDFGAGAGGASQVIVKALNGTTVLSSASLNLTGTTMQFLNTSAFTSLSSITGYQIDRVATGNGSYGGSHWVADDFTFGVVPEPPAGGVAVALSLLGLGGWRVWGKSGRKVPASV